MFDSARWCEPRKSIATGLNDLQYGTHGGLLAMEVLKKFDRNLNDYKNLSLFDFGCGTGRVSRVMCAVFREVVAYDPSLQAIALAHEESKPVQRIIYHNLKFYNTLPQVSCDFGMSINVFEHVASEHQLKYYTEFVSRVKHSAVIYVKPCRSKSLPIKFENPDSNIVEMYVVKGQA